jgi:ribosomal protein S18 acetylase RimI-like enzyme
LPFAQFWLQTTDDDCPVAAVSKLDDVLTLCTAPGANYEELKELISILNVKCVLCDLSAAQAINLPIARQGEIMIYKNQESLSTQSFEDNPDLVEVHKLLCACKTESFTPPEYEPFYLDMSHRVRHGTSRAVGVQKENVLISCAIAAAQTEHAAVLSAVATHPDYQHKGFGSRAVLALLSLLPQEPVFIFRAQNENAAFYRSLRFGPYGEWAEADL